jgi:hypothetical protein
VHQIDLKEFNKHKIGRAPYYLMPTEERFWYKHEDRLGIVLFDKIDKDWSFVVLCEHRDGRYRCYDLGTSFKDSKSAEAALQTAINNPGYDTDHESPPNRNGEG